MFPLPWLALTAEGDALVVSSRLCSPPVFWTMKDWTEAAIRTSVFLAGARVGLPSRCPKEFVPLRPRSIDEEISGWG
jgi:hypothetical protein